MGVLKNIRTREDLEYLASDLEELRTSLYRGNAGVSPPLIIQQDFDTASDKGEYLESLREQILAARVLELTVSDYLDEPVLAEVSGWIKQNVGEDVVLNVRVEPILAGAKIAFNGRYEDYSLKNKLDKAIVNIGL